MDTVQHIDPADVPNPSNAGDSDPSHTQTRPRRGLRASVAALAVTAACSGGGEGSATSVEAVSAEATPTTFETSSLEMSADEARTADPDSTIEIETPPSGPQPGDIIVPSDLSLLSEFDSERLSLFMEPNEDGEFMPTAGVALDFSIFNEPEQLDPESEPLRTFLRDATGNFFAAINTGNGAILTETGGGPDSEFGMFANDEAAFNATLAEHPYFLRVQSGIGGGEIYNVTVSPGAGIDGQTQVTGTLSVDLVFRDPDENITDSIINGRSATITVVDVAYAVDPGAQSIDGFEVDVGEIIQIDRN